MNRSERLNLMIVADNGDYEDSKPTVGVALANGRRLRHTEMDWGRSVQLIPRPTRKAKGGLTR